MPIQKTTKEEIIRNCIRVFRRKGYYRTSISDLAEESKPKLTKGVFYHHFKGGKQEIMQTALRATSQWFEMRVFGVAYSPELSAKEKLNQMAESAFKAFTDDLGGCFFANTILETAHVEDTFLPEINRFFSVWQKAFEEVFRYSYSEEEIPELVEQIIADIEGSIILMQLHKNPKYLRKAFDRTIQKL